MKLDPHSCIANQENQRLSAWDPFLNDGKLYARRNQLKIGLRLGVNRASLAGGPPFSKTGHFRTDTN
jgi:hypothetical protein